MIEEVARSPDSINIQSYPAIEGDTIKILSPGDKLLISMHGNGGSTYAIDTDTKIDSALMGYRLTEVSSILSFYLRARSKSPPPSIVPGTQ